MQIVINLSEEDYNCIDDCILGVYGDAIKNGTLLPKGHGRLIDAYTLENKYLLAFVRDVIDTIPTIIEADKEKNK